MKAYIAIPANEVTDEVAKEGSVRADTLVVTDRGIRALWKRVRAPDRAMVGFSSGRIVR